MAGIQAVVAIVGGAFILFISVFTAAQGIRAKAVADAASDRAEQLAHRVDEQDATIAAERRERAADKERCARDLARLRGQLDAATSQWARDLAPHIASELVPLIVAAIREAAA